MSGSDLNSLAYCGLYCGACSFKVAFQEVERGHLAAMPARYDKYKGDPLEDCPGCRADSENTGCKIRTCAIARNVAHCGECADFPCKVLSEFASDGVPHHSEVITGLKAVREMGAHAWLAAQKERFTCPCGKRLSWYVRKCIHAK